MNTKLKKVEIVEHNWSDTSIVRGGDTVCTLTIYDEVSEHTQEALELIMSEDAKVIADALTTIQSCGLLPSQLLKQRDEMRAVLEEINAKIIAGSKIEFATVLHHKIFKLLESTNP